MHRQASRSQVLRDQMADLLQQVLDLAASVYDATQCVFVAGGDCGRLGRGVKAVAALLERARATLLALPKQKVEPALQVLLDALSTAREVLPEFKMSSSLCAVVYAGDLKAKLQNVGTVLGAAVGMLPAVHMAASFKEQEQIVQLSKELQNLQCTMLDALQRLFSRLEYLMQYDERKLFQLVMHILDCSPTYQALSEQQRIEAEAIELKSHLLRSRAEDAHGEQYLHSFIALLNIHQLGGPQDQAQHPHHHLLDPLNLELMHDPVVLAESGITYDRSSIEDWLGKKGLLAFLTGELVDPLTGKELSKFPPDLAPSLTVRQAVLEWQQVSKEADGCSNGASRSSGLDSLPPLLSLPSSDAGQVFLDDEDADDSSHLQLPALADLLWSTFNIRLSEAALWKLAIALQEGDIGGSVHSVHSQLLELVKSTHTHFMAADWRGCKSLDVDMAYEVFKQSGFTYVSLSQFKELCSTHASKHAPEALDLDLLLTIIGTALFELWKNFRCLSGRASMVDIKQLHQVLTSSQLLMRVTLQDAQTMVRYHGKSSDKGLKFPELWELHNTVVALVTAFHNEDRSGSGLLREEQVMRALMHTGVVTLTQPLLRDAWRKVAPRQLQLSCSTLLSLFYHLLNTHQHVSLHVNTFYGVGLRKEESAALGTAPKPNGRWRFETFWESLKPGKMLRSRYEVRARCSLDAQRGSCRAYDCCTCTYVHLHFFFHSQDLLRELEVMQLMQPIHVVTLIECWEIGQDEEGAHPATLVSLGGCATLEGWLEQQRLKPSPLSERRDLLAQVLEALADLELTGRVHLGLSPSNIVHTWDAEQKQHRWKLTGLCHSIPLGQAGMVATPLVYTAPELADCCGQAELTGVDGSQPHAWSMAVIAYQLLTGAQLCKDSVPSPLIIKRLTQQLLPTLVHKSHLSQIVGTAEMNLLEAMLQVSPQSRPSPRSVLHDYFPQRISAPDMESMERQLQAKSAASASGAANAAGVGPLGLLRSWQAAAQWALQPSPTIKQQMKQAQEQIKAYAAEVLFNATGPVPFPWPPSPPRSTASRSRSSTNTPQLTPNKTSSKTPPRTSMETPLKENPVKPLEDNPFMPALEDRVKPLLGNPLKPSLENPIRPTLENPLKPTLENPVKPTLDNPLKPVLDTPMEVPPLKTPSETPLNLPSKKPPKVLLEAPVKTPLEIPLAIPLEQPVMNQLETPSNKPVETLPKTTTPISNITVTATPIPTVTPALTPIPATKQSASPASSANASKPAPSPNSTPTPEPTQDPMADPTPIPPPTQPQPLLAPPKEQSVMEIASLTNIASKMWGAFLGKPFTKLSDSTPPVVNAVVPPPGNAAASSDGTQLAGAMAADVDVEAIVGVASDGVAAGGVSNANAKVVGTTAIAKATQPAPDFCAAAADSADMAVVGSSPDVTCSVTVASTKSQKFTPAVATAVDAGAATNVNDVATSAAIAKAATDATDAAIAKASTDATDAAIAKAATDAAIAKAATDAAIAKAATDAAIARAAADAAIAKAAADAAITKAATAAAIARAAADAAVAKAAADAVVARAAADAVGAKTSSNGANAPAAGAKAAAIVTSPTIVGDSTIARGVTATAVAGKRTFTGSDRSDANGKATAVVANPTFVGDNPPTMGGVTATVVANPTFIGSSTSAFGVAGACAAGARDAMADAASTTVAHRASIGAISTVASASDRAGDRASARASDRGKDTAALAAPAPATAVPAVTKNSAASSRAALLAGEPAAVHSSGVAVAASAQAPASASGVASAQAATAVSDAGTAATPAGTAVTPAGTATTPAGTAVTPAQTPVVHDAAAPDVRSTGIVAGAIAAASAAVSLSTAPTSDDAVRSPPLVASADGAANAPGSRVTGTVSGVAAARALALTAAAAAGASTASSRPAVSVTGGSVAAAAARFSAIAGASAAGAAKDVGVSRSALPNRPLHSRSLSQFAARPLRQPEPGEKPAVLDAGAAAGAPVKDAAKSSPGNGFVSSAAKQFGAARPVSASRQIPVRPLTRGSASVLKSVRKFETGKPVTDESGDVLSFPAKDVKIPLPPDIMKMSPRADLAKSPPRSDIMKSCPEIDITKISQRPDAMRGSPRWDITRVSDRTDKSLSRLDGARASPRREITKSSPRAHIAKLSPRVDSTKTSPRTEPTKITLRTDFLKSPQFGKGTASSSLGTLALGRAPVKPSSGRGTSVGEADVMFYNPNFEVLLKPDLIDAPVKSALLTEELIPPPKGRATRQSTSERTNGVYGTSDVGGLRDQGLRNA